MMGRRGKEPDSIRLRTCGSCTAEAVAADYLDVKWRLLWLRKEHPDAEIVTELVQHDPQMAIFKATVTVPTGGKATGYGSETASDFPDFIEKAETKAIGRALNALGYGAQFGDFQRPEDLGAGARSRASSTPRQSPPRGRSRCHVSMSGRRSSPEAKSETAGETPAATTSPAGRRSRVGRLLLERVLAMGAGTRAEWTAGDRESDRQAGRRALTRRTARFHSGG